MNSKKAHSIKRPSIWSFWFEILKPVYWRVREAMIVSLIIYFTISVYVASLVNNVDLPEGSFDEQCHLPIATLYCNGSYGEVRNPTGVTISNLNLIFISMCSGILKSPLLLVCTFLLWHRSNFSIWRAPSLIWDFAMFSSIRSILFYWITSFRITRWAFFFVISFVGFYML